MPLQRNDVLNKIQHILKNQLGVDGEISEATTIADLKADSMLLMGLVLEIENEFGIYLGNLGSNPPKDIKELIDHVLQQTN